MKKHILRLRSFIALLFALLFLGNNAHAQVYLLENFDSAFVGTPGAPPGWTQTKFDYWGDGIPTAINVIGPKDWQRNKLISAGLWSFQGFGTNPNTAVTDSGALWLEDYYFGSQTNMMSRRIESPAVNLATATSPYLRFNMFFAQNSNYAYPIIVMASNDNGATWKSIMHVQPNADVVTTSTSGSGFMNGTTPWQKITVKIPDAYKVANAKFAFYRNNPYSFNSNPFIDSLTIEEFTPNTITSAQSGNWSDSATWVGGIVPNSNSNVVIAANHTVTSNVNISRMQNLTISSGASFLYFSSSVSTVSQIFGNLNIDATGTFNIGTSASSTVGRWLYVGGNLTVNGTLNMGTSTTSVLYLTGGSPSVVSNNGTISNGYISGIYFTNSAGTTFNTAMTGNVVIRNVLFMVDGPIVPNGKLVAGIFGNAITITRANAKTFFTERPIYPALGTFLRSVTYGGGTSGNPTMGIFYKDTIFVGNETDTLTTGVHFIRGTFTMFTQNHVKLRTPLQIGDTIGGTTTVSATNAGGLTTFSRGILFTDNTNILTVGPIGNGSTGIAPSLNTAIPPTTHGSYIVGPIRFVRPSSGSLTTTLSVPFGYGSEYLGLATPNNVRRYMQITSGAGWAGQIITLRALTNPTGTVSAPQTSLITNKLYSVSLQSGQNLPATSTLTVSTMTEGGGISNVDALLGSQNELFLMQSANPTGPWTVRSTAAGAGAFLENNTYTRTTAATAPGPISGNGEFFAWASSAQLMNFQNGDVVRETAPVSVSAQNMPMLRVRVNVNGVIPTRVSGVNFNTTGTSRLAAIASAKVFYTGSSSAFNSSVQFGSTSIAPSGAISVSGNQILVNGDNYFWIAYDVATAALLGDSLVANLDNIVAVDTARVLTTTPSIGYRIVSAPMTFVSATADQMNFVKVEIGESNAEILKLTVNMSAIGAPIAASTFQLTTNGSANPFSNISNAIVYYTGANNSFSTAQPLGSFANPNGSFVINGNMNLLNGVNNFWLAYNIRTTATLGDSVDATWDSITIGGISRTVTNNNPSGSRAIRAQYCPSAATTNGDEEIWNVTFGSINNTSNCTTLAPGLGSVNSMYSNYTTSVAAPNIAAGISIPFSVNAASCGGNYPSTLRIFIDYNQNGIFDLPGEQAYINNSFTSSTTGSTIVSGNITVPCTALSGITRMRVVLDETGGAQACGTYAWGETEDYNINIVAGAASYTASNAIQFTGTTSSGATDVRVLRVPVKVASSPCNPGVISEFKFNTAGSTSAADITSAKLYKTGNSNVFSTTNLVGTVASPSGQFTFTVADTAVNDTNNYWLAYDVSATATATNLLDARLDSMQVFGNWYTPIISAPAGNLVITTPMTYIATSVIHPDLTMAERPSTNARMLRAMVRMSSIGAPVSVTQLSLDANGGGDDTSNIANVKVFYTGSSANFASTNQFGTTFVQTTPTGNKYGAFNINGTLSLLNDTNYFWVTYDIKNTAILGDSVDAELAGITIAGISRTPSNTAPSGNRKIRAQYCASNATTTGDEEIWNVTIGSLNNTSTCATTAPGPGSVNSQYSNYTGFVAAPNLAAGLPIAFSVNAAACGFTGYPSTLRIFIDYNQNGIFDLPGEQAYLNNSFTSSTTGATILSGNITVPCSALPGITRMRVVLDETSGAQACGTYLWGETEDYDVNIVSGAAAFRNVSVNQNTGATAASATDVRILRIPVVMTSSPCNPAIIDGFRFNTAGSTSAADIANAKLYTTRNSGVFNNNNLLGTATSPSGQFTFTVADTLNNDTNFYWLTYDVSATATNSNVLDARLDSINLLGNWYLPANGSPAGNVVIATPMTYVSSSAIHPDQGIIETSSTNNRMLRLLVRMSATGAPVALTQFNLNANGGGDDTSNIANVKVFSTGNSATFNTANQYGTTFVQTAPTGNKYGAFNINGTINLLNDTNYFWVTYNIKSTAIIGDSVDAEITGITIGGISQTPSNTAPAGSRRIRGPYCPSAAQFAGDGEIWNVTIGALNNTSNCTVAGPGVGSTLSLYANYSESIAPVNIVAGVSIPFSVNTSTCGGNYNGVLGIWIDLNQDGDFVDAGETVHMTPTFLYGTTVFRTGNIVIPCTAAPGLTRMRVILNETTASPISSCGSYFYGETEDYTVNIVNAAPVYNASTAQQQISTTSAGATDVPILRVPIRVTSSSCSPGTVNEFRFNTIGTTTAANILSAKLYKTGNSAAFATTNLVATVSTPSGAFSFLTTDTLINDTNYYWLAYDVTATAANSNVLDARFDSALVYTNWVVPTVSNPTGNVLISTPMTYIGSEVSHPDAGMIEAPSTNNRMLRVRVRMSSTGSPITLTQLNLSTNGGGVDTLNIANVKVFYTGTSSTFATTNQFGSTFIQSTPTGASWGAFNVNGLIALANDTNYIWVTYDIKTTAIIGDSVDAECTGLTIGGVSQTPSNTAPAGSRKIRAPYCASASQFAGDGEIFNVTLSALNNTSNCTVAATGPGSTLSLYANYSESVPATLVNAGELVQFSVNTATCNGNYDGVMGMWIDFNQDGDFTDAGETVVMTQSFLYGVNVFQTGSFNIPLTASIGRTRMRVILNETTASPISPCGSYFYGETEDYTIEILPATNITYTWNQTGGGNLVIPTNWTPARLKSNLNDKLLINTGNASTFTGVGNQTVRALEFGNNTVANFTASAAIVTATDSIILGNSARVITNTNLMVLGADTSKIGAIQSGTTAGISGNLRRWFNNSTPLVNFPLVSAAGVNRSVTMDYNTMPGTIGSITASFIGTAPGNSGLPLYDSTAFISINRAGIDGYWSITPTNGTVGGNYDLNLNATGFTGVSNYLQLVALRRNSPSSPWVSNGSHLAASGSNAAPIVNRNNLNQYGDFGVGADTLVNPLPVELLSFFAKNVNGDVKLNWSTSSETNNKGFFIERSLDGVNYNDLDFVAGAGNSKSVKNYGYLDENAFNLASTIYYRLRQVDFDGTATLSNVAIVSENDRIEDGISVYPNPFSHATGVLITAANGGIANIEVVDILGRIVATQSNSIVMGSQYLNLNGLNQLTAGVYTVRINIGNIVSTIKVQKID